MTRLRVQQNVPAMTSLLLRIYVCWDGLASKSLQRIFFIIIASFWKKSLRKLDSLGFASKISAIVRVGIRLLHLKQRTVDGTGAGVGDG
jgi:hypothetical protein